MDRDLIRYRTEEGTVLILQWLAWMDLFSLLCNLIYKPRGTKASQVIVCDVVHRVGDSASLSKLKTYVRTNST